MTPVEFEGVNIVLGKDQPQYLPLPAIKLEGREGAIISCWELTEEELQEVIKTKRLFFCQCTFGHYFQPIRPAVSLSDLIIKDDQG